MTTDGSVFGFGANASGELGNGSTALSTVPVPVLLDRGQIAVGTGGSAEGNHSLALVLRLTGR